ncbi:hypothetical protein Tco_1383340 [Tanacetum coccineum]
MRSHFFWGRNSGQRKMAWVNWDSVMASYSRGGLNIGSLESFNLSLLLKWRWRFVHNDNMLWVHVIDPSVLKKHVGNGASTRFWEDLWLDCQLLSSHFPRLYALENFKNVAISDRWNDVAWFWQ